MRLLAPSAFSREFFYTNIAIFYIIFQTPIYNSESECLLVMGGFHDIIHLVMQWTGQDFEDGGRFVFDITSMVKTDFRSYQLVSLIVLHKDT